ncbi:MAG: GTPase HflX [Clostridia bacterium]|nr:GTPase HflX [Clostridia bacterium]
MQENIEQKVQVLIVGVNINDKEYFNESMEELISLVEACNMEVCGRIEQNLKVVNKPLYIGTGKVVEVKEKAKECHAEVIVFNNELSPTQLRNLQKDLDMPILDRTSLILEIFSTRAKTREAKLQVEVAKLQYMLPRLVGLHESLGRQGGASGLSNKGAGEKKLELDRRRIEDKLTELRKELEEVEQERNTQRKQRNESGIPKVALVGYTNAGKSTLMNAMVDMYLKDDTKKVMEKDMLFATLETSVRKITLENNKSFLLSDTVGFISELPHNLVKAFRSTLEEVKCADLLLNVIDYSDQNYEEHIKVTKETLKSLGADEIPVIYVFNKSDLMLDRLPLIDDNEIYMSASNKKGMKELIELISSRIYTDYIDCEMLVPFDKGNIVSYFNNHATIKETEYLESGTLLKMNCKLSDYNKYIEYVKKA